MNILLVEDNIDNAQLFIRILQTAGYGVVHTTRGIEGMREALSRTFDAVILDFDLPDIDGAQVGLALRRQIGTIPLIAITAHAEKVTRVKAQAFGFDAFISKPCTDEDLLETVARFTQHVTSPSHSTD